MEIIFNNKKTDKKIQEIIEKEISKFIEENKNSYDFEIKKESFLRNRNYSFSLKDNVITIFSL